MPPELQEKGKVFIGEPKKKNDGSNEYSWAYVNNKKCILGLFDALSKLGGTRFGIDIETYPKKQFRDNKQGGLLPAKSKIRTIQIYTGSGVAIFDFLDPSNGKYLLTDPDIVSRLWHFLEGKKLIAHNALFETSHLQNLFLAHNIVKPLDIYCTMNAYRLILQATEEDSKAFKADLASVCKNVLGLHVPKDEQASDWSAPTLTKSQLDYCARDAVLPYLLFEVLLQNLNDMGMVKLYKLNTKAQDVVAHMTIHGFTVDTEAHEKLVEKWRKEKELWNDKCFYLLNAGKEQLTKDELKTIITAKVTKKYIDTIWSKTEKMLQTVDRVPRNVTLDDFINIRARYTALAEKNAGKIPAAERACKRAAKNITEYLLNINSGKQLGTWLKANVDTSNWPLTDSGNTLKTDAETLNDYAHIEVIQPLIEYKKYEKLYSVYGVGLREFFVQKPDGRTVIHPNFTLCYTETGRMSSRDPNCQNWTRGEEIRSLIIPKNNDYKILHADFNQVELRIFALISGDKVMMDAYENGIDIHALTGTAISGKTEHQCDPYEWKEIRQAAKSANFALIFGGGAARLRAYAKAAFKVNISEEEAERIVQVFRETYFGGRQWQLDHSKDCEELLEVRTHYGKIRKLSSDNSYTCGLNTPIQGTAAEIMLLSMVKILEGIRGKFDARILNVVHDEIIVECHNGCIKEVSHIMKSSMEESFLILFPGATINGLIEKIGVGDNWYDAK